MNKRTGSTISVPSLSKILGLKKTEGYWLVKKNYFQTVTISGKKRIVVSSFEDWYNKQTHYLKASGPEPQVVLKSKSYSVKEISDLLGISQKSVRDLCYRKKLKSFVLQGRRRVRKDWFENWYQSQEHFRKPEDLERDRKAEESSMTVTEMSRLLCISRNRVYHLIEENTLLHVIKIAGRTRITISSFEKWYAQQSEYRKFEDRKPAEQKHIYNTHQSDPLGKALENKTPHIDDNNPWCSIKEAAFEMETSESTVKRLIQSGILSGKQISHKWFVLKDDIKLYIIHQKSDNIGRNI